MKNPLLLFSLFPIKIRRKHVFLKTILSHRGFFCSRRLFLTFGNLTSNLINTRTFVKTNNKCKKHENCFEEVFHLQYITRNVKHGCNNKL